VTVDISYTEFYPIRTKSTKNTEKVHVSHW